MLKIYKIWLQKNHSQIINKGIVIYRKLFNEQVVLIDVLFSYKFLKIGRQEKTNFFNEYILFIIDNINKLLTKSKSGKNLYN